MYLLLIYMRPYPGGSAARFRPPGLLYTVVEVAILSALSLLVALLLAAIQWLLQKIRLVVKRSETSAEGDRRGNGP
jgi:hypothetical protein